MVTDAYHHGFLAGYWPAREPLPCPYDGEQGRDWERGRQGGIRKAVVERAKPIPPKITTKGKRKNAD